MRFSIVLVLAAVGVLFTISDVFGQGRGIGRQVSAMAKSGVHGPALAAQIHALQAARGIGAVNGAGTQQFGQQSGQGFAYGQQKGKNRVHGNNGLGNGIDPQPPGNPPVNDGPGTFPGNPGNRMRGRR